MEQTVAHLIERLDLVRHPEGGWYRETYRSGEVTIQWKPAVLHGKLLPVGKK